jgi:hypothetical protein
VLLQRPCDQSIPFLDGSGVLLGGRDVAVECRQGRFGGLCLAYGSDSRNRSDVARTLPAADATSRSGLLQGAFSKTNPLGSAGGVENNGSCSDVLDTNGNMAAADDGLIEIK